MATKKAASSNGDVILATRVDALEQRVGALEAGRPGRKAKPMIALRQQGVCALDPERDSATCPDASIFRYQVGCHGTACRAKQHNAYERRKAKKAAVTKKATRRATAKVPTKKVNLTAEVKKTVAKRSAVKAPAKKAPAKRVAKSTAAAAAG